MKKLLLLGGGGHCRSVLDSLLAGGEYDEIGIVDYAPLEIPGATYAGTDDDLPELRKQGWTYGFITVGSIGNTGIRRKLYRILKEAGMTIPVVTDPSASVARDAEIGEGTFIGKNAVVNAGAVIGCNAIINTGAIVEHECRVGGFTHISSGAVLCGQVQVGEDTHLGAGTVVRQGISIGSGTLIGIGSVVTKNIPDGVKAYGNPCRVVQNEHLYHC